MLHLWKLLRFLRNTESTGRGKSVERLCEFFTKHNFQDLNDSEFIVQLPYDHFQEEENDSIAHVFPAESSKCRFHETGLFFAILAFFLLFVPISTKSYLGLKCW